MSEERTDAQTTTEPATDADAEIARLRSELETASQRAAELLDRARRAQADYANLERRAAREAEQVREVANEGLLVALLPLLDDFDHAIAGLPGEAGEGVRMIQAKLSSVLRDAGLEPVDPTGQPFDPYEHEVVGAANDEGLSNGIVKEVVQKGYRYRRRLLRPAKVIVVKRGE
jgi:molecular chaperone GrpE